MSFTTTHPTTLGISAMSGWELWESNPEATDSGWDTCLALFAKDFRGASVTGSDVAREFTIGENMGGNWWAAGIRARRKAGNIWLAEVGCKGLLETRDIKVSGRSSVEQQSADQVGIPNAGTVNKAQILESSPTVEIEYISFSPPPTQKVGLAGLPLITPATRLSVWAQLNDPVYHYPNGWVMVDIEWDKLLGANVWLVKEIWAKIFPFSP